MTADTDRLLALIARGSTPWERIGGGAFATASAQHEAVLASRRAAWIDRASRGDAAAFARLLGERGIRMSDWEASLSDVVVARPGALPPWATVLMELFADFPDAHGKGGGEAGAGPIDPLRRAAVRPVLRRMAEMHCIDPGAVDGMLAWFDKRLLAACSASLRAEARLRLATKRAPTADPMALPADRAGWLGRLERQAALGALIGTVMHDWQVAMDELLRRLAADLPAIATTFFGGGEPGMLREIEYGTGDPHRGGRSVAILTFDRGKVLYKPKDLRAAAALERLLRALAADGVPDLACPPLLLRGDYAWEGFVAPAPCGSLAAADRFYGRLGAWARLFQLLGSIDFWFDNLIAAGDRPMFVDFETIMHPSGPFDELNRDSPADTGILPWLAPTRIGADPSDLGCLARPGEHRAPLPAVTADGAHIPGTVASADGLIAWREDRFAPFVEGRWADVADHFPAFEEGYAAMHHRLGGAGASVERFLADTGDAPLRYILIDTWSCYRLIEMGTAPGALSDGVRREIALEGFWPAYPHVPAALGSGIIHDLRRIDVPMLECRAESAALATVSGGSAPAYFRQPAAAGVRDRLRAPRGLAHGIACLRSAFSTRPDRPRRPAAALAAGRIPSRLEAAQGVGRTILAAWRAADREPQRMIGLVTVPAFGIRRLGALSRDILSGTAGLALFLAELHTVTADAEAGACALCLADDLCVPPRSDDWSVDGYGAAIGLGARLRALITVAHHLHRPELLDRARPLLDLFPGAAAATQPVHIDWCGGVAGLLAVLAKLQALRPDLGAGAVAARAVAFVRSAARRQLVAAGAPSAWASVLHRLPTAACGWRIVACQWPTLVDDDLQAGIAPVLHEAPDGDSVGELRALLSLQEAPDLADRVRRRVREPAPDQPDDDRAAGLLDRLTLALSAGLRSDAERLADQLAAGYVASGSWFPDDWAEDIHRLSAVDGIAAIGRAMLRLA